MFAALKFPFNDKSPVINVVPETVKLPAVTFFATVTFPVVIATSFAINALPNTLKSLFTCKSD